MMQNVFPQISARLTRRHLPPNINTAPDRTCGRANLAINLIYFYKNIFVRKTGVIYTDRDLRKSLCRLYLGNSSRLLRLSDMFVR